ncbi:uncharacterized protein Anr2p [[Candida] railenensis]|uniref:Uncharacterized protein Anr2p n=1 Tax=[Candida] railenensis TaxID=45579 RepID=A0A9P0QVX4_9ASCO|nr:uncharacterized protein Anr2p [[Candida] railenensis]
MSNPLEPDYSPPKIAACFLVNFDTSVGYKFVWSKVNEGLDLTGLEYKCLPSGLHEKDSDTILISHKAGNRIYYGLCKFFQNLGDFGSNEQVDRSNVKMYAVGILCEPLTPSASMKSDSSWKPNEFVHNGWEYLEDLDATLRKFVAQREFQNFELFEELYSRLIAGGSTRSTKKIENHLLKKLPVFLQTLGPLTFCLYKQALLRKRILFFQQNHSKVTNFDLGAFTYLLSLISIVPKGIEIVKNEQFAEDESDESNLYSRPIYSIGLNDLGGTLAGSASTIGCTNDSILMYQRNIFDYAVFIPCEEFDEPFVVGAKTLTNNHGHTPSSSDGELKSTLKDYYKFKLVYKDYFNRHKCGNNSTSQDDASSIKTKSSTFSSRFGTQFIKYTNPKVFGEYELESEPSWWLESATAPISWREYIWSAFSWFASAGTVTETVIENSNIGYSNGKRTGDSQDNSILALDSSNSEENVKKNFIELVELVGNFHKLTKKWFYLINEVVIEELDLDIDGNGVHQALVNRSKISIELTYQDIIDMELDPYSHEDLDFVKEFVTLYWGSVVENVEIGLGLSSICC